jgi:transposase
MRYELTDHEWTAIRTFLPNKPRGVPRVNDRPQVSVAERPVLLAPVAGSKTNVLRKKIS